MKAEAMDRLMAQVGAMHDRQCRCVLFLDGRLDGERLKRAVALSLEAAPVLGCRYVPDWWRPRWENGPGEVPFSEVETADGQGEIDRFLGEEMDPLTGPQAAVRLVRSVRDALCIKLHHVAADGGAVNDFARMLADFYRNPEHRVRAGDRGLGQVLRGAGWGAAARGCLRVRYPESAWGLKCAGRDFSGRAFRFCQAGPEAMEGVKKYCRKRGAKVADVLVTGFYRAMTAVLKPEAGARLPVQLTIDLRRYLPEGKAGAICDLASAYYPVVRHVPGMDFEGTLGAVEAAVAEARRGEPWLGTALVLQALSAFPATVDRVLAGAIIRRQMAAGVAHPFLSNLGVIEEFEFGDAEVTDVGIFGPVPYPPNVLAGMYTFRGRLALTSSFCEAGMVDGVFERWLEEMPRG